MGLFGSSDIGLDLGTSTVLAYVRRKGIVLREPSVVAIERGTGKLVAIGGEALDMLGREPEGLIVLRPLAEGVISNFDATERMLTNFFSRLVGNRIFFKPRVVIAVPSKATEVEKRAVIETSEGAGARYTYLIDEPLAAAIGAGVDIISPKGNLILDVGAGTSDMVVTSLGRAVISASIRVGGDKFDEAIIRYFKRQHGIAVGVRAAEEMKINFASASPRSEPIMIDVRGRSLGSGQPASMLVDSNELVTALADPLRQITEQLRDMMEATPAELCGDITENGMCLTGGGSLLFGLDKYITDHTGIPCYVAEDPISSVAIGCGKVLENVKLYDDVLYDYRRGDYYEI